MSITVHCIVKNEENFIWYAIKSVIDIVDFIIIFDTGSEDGTVDIINGLKKEYPNKVTFEQKGVCDKKRHTKLRQEMINRTETEWFMILDGDEVWSKRGMEEVQSVINRNGGVECVIAPFYLCVGDVYHTYYKKGDYEFLNQRGFFSPRFFKNTQGIQWVGDYNQDTLVFNNGVGFVQEENTVFMHNKYWHLTHLRRSSKDDGDFSSFGSRVAKRRETYIFIGRKIQENIPEVFIIKKTSLTFHLSRVRALYNLLKLFFLKLHV